MSGKALEITGIDTEARTVCYVTRNRTTNETYEHTTRISYLERNSLLKVAKMLGHKFNPSIRSPLAYTGGELRDIIHRLIEDGATSVTTTTPTPPVVQIIPNRPLPTSGLPSVAAKLNNVVADAIATAMAEMSGSGVDEATVMNWVAGSVGNLELELNNKLTANNKVFTECLVSEIATLKRHVAELIADSKPTITNITLSGGTTKAITGRTHNMFEKVLRVVDAGLAPWLTGGAGVGKSILASQVAESLGLSFYPESFCSQSSKSEMKGYNTANGIYSSVDFRKAFEQGGVYLLDEVDAANPNILLVLNGALSNGIMGFPDGVVRKHPKFVAIAAANTYGNGATAEYVGRQVIDGSTLDRFVKLDIGIDEKLESGVCNDISSEAVMVERWITIVRAARANVIKDGLKVIVSPRASYHGVRLLEAGFSYKETVGMTFGSGCKPETLAKVMNGVNVYSGGK